MRGRVVTGVDPNTQHGKPHVRLTTQNKLPFYFQRENKIFLDALPKSVDRNKASASAHTLPRGKVREMSEIFDQLFRKQLERKVSKLKEFFKICLSLIHDKDVVTKLTSLTEETQKVL